MLLVEVVLVVVDMMVFSIVVVDRFFAKRHWLLGDGQCRWPLGGRRCPEAGRGRWCRDGGGKDRNLICI